MKYYAIKGNVYGRGGVKKAYWNTEINKWMSVSALGAILFADNYFFGSINAAKKYLELHYHLMLSCDRYKLDFSGGINIIEYNDNDLSEKAVSVLKWKDIDPNDGWVD